MNDSDSNQHRSIPDPEPAPPATDDRAPRGAGSAPTTSEPSRYAGSILELDLQGERPLDPPAGRRRFTAALAIAGILGLTAAGVVLALELASNSADHAAFAAPAPTTSPSEVAVKVTDIEPSPTYEETLAAVLWAAQHDGKKPPTTIQFAAGGDETLVPGEAQVTTRPQPTQEIHEKAAPGDEPKNTLQPSTTGTGAAGLQEDPGQEYTYTLVVISPSELPAGVKAQKSKLAEAMVEAQGKSACGGVAAGVTAPSGKTPTMLLVQCPDGSYEQTELTASYQVSKLEPAADPNSPYRLDIKDGSGTVVLLPTPAP